ncbi:hypothetical protein ACJX0J_018881 [Zea mays]
MEAISQGTQIHAHAIKNALIDMYAKCAHLTAARIHGLIIKSGTSTCMQNPFNFTVTYNCQSKGMVLTNFGPIELLTGMKHSVLFFNAILISDLKNLCGRRETIEDTHFMPKHVTTKTFKSSFLFRVVTNIIHMVVSSTSNLYLRYFFSDDKIKAQVHHGRWYHAVFLLLF